MAQPKEPPISIRLPKALIAEIDAWATDHGLTRNATIRALIELGLRKPVAPQIRNVAATKSAPFVDKKGEAAKFGATAPHVDVPLARPFSRPPGSMLKGAKKP